MKKTRFIMGIIIICILIAGGYFTLVKLGFIFYDEVDKEYYKVRGITVTEEEGEINWPIVASNDDISYAFIRATKGSVYKDTNFVTNFNNAIKNNIIVGPYHEYMIDAKGETQATHFVSTYRSQNENVTPPLVKLFFDNETISDDDVTQLVLDIVDFLKYVETKIEKKPIIYTSNKTYQDILRNQSEFDDYPICIENTKYQPMIMDDKDWSFWQYTYDGEIKGCKNKLPKSVFYSDAKTFSYFCKGDFLSQQKEYNETEKNANK